MEAKFIFIETWEGYDFFFLLAMRLLLLIDWCGVWCDSSVTLTEHAQQTVMEGLRWRCFLTLVTIICADRMIFFLSLSRFESNIYWENISFPGHIVVFCFLYHIVGDEFTGVSEEHRIHGGSLSKHGRIILKINLKCICGLSEQQLCNYLLLTMGTSFHWVS